MPTVRAWGMRNWGWRWPLRPRGLQVARAVGAQRKARPLPGVRGGSGHSQLGPRGSKGTREGVTGAEI